MHLCDGYLCARTYTLISVPSPCHQGVGILPKSSSHLVAVRILTSVHHFHLKEPWLLGKMVSYGFVIIFKENLGHLILKSKESL